MPSQPSHAGHPGPDLAKVQDMCAAFPPQNVEQLSVDARDVLWTARTWTSLFGNCRALERLSVARAQTKYICDALLLGVDDGGLEATRSDAPEPFVPPREEYNLQEVLLSVVKERKARDMPLDALHIVQILTNHRLEAADYKPFVQTVTVEEYVEAFDF
ncbi:hypothetical protein BV25DRAFT_1915408 [Artomyces pyxidatus]|uniref:Uncharacterized protein n=1 Tax=Artomyces pyxidatus TaxID=48021 RepID=A0ACB8T3I6_9AGAM|nr:hypothetical protein BV25DRAFT_1915408 [Artomyces pyxidatus]